MKTLVRSAFLLITLCTQLDAQSVERLIATDATVKTLAIGFQFTEGPAVAADGSVVFSDIPNSRIHHWSTDGKISVLRENTGRANGLFYLPDGRLVACEGGNRQVTVMGKDGKIKVLANECNGKKLNSPNDLAIRKNGDIFFTDPIYGLPKRASDPMREIDFCGVYRLQKDGTVTLQYKGMSRPNGIGFSPDHNTLYVANSDGRDPVWRAFPVGKEGNLGAPRAFFDSSKDDRVPRSGGDGLKVDAKGNVFATGAGGVLILSPEGKLLGRLVTGESIANVGWGNDGTVLYLTSDMYLCRIKTKTKGAGF